jgi:hypothetical protein
MRQIDNGSIHEITIVSWAGRRSIYSGSRAWIDEETVDEEHAKGRARAVMRVHFPETWFAGTRAGLRSPASVRRHRSPSIRCMADEGMARRRNGGTESETVFRESNEPWVGFRIQDVSYIYWRNQTVSDSICSNFMNRPLEPLYVQPIVVDVAV